MPASAQYRVRFVEDPEASFEECNGESRPLTEDEYAENQYRACPDHPRAGSEFFTDASGQRQTGCRVCHRTDYADIPYSEYRAYYGNPDRHVYLMSAVQRQCPCCKAWQTVGGTCSIDFMDDSPELRAMNTWYREDQIVSLPGYLREVAEEDIRAAKDEHEAEDADPLAQHASSPALDESRRQLEQMYPQDPRD